jgi:hypothetical protein
MEIQAGFLLGCALAVASLAHAAAPAAQNQSPWSRVPAFPTSRYSTDGYSDKVLEVRTAVDADRERQQQINDNLSRKATGAGGGETDPFKMAAQIQQKMMNDPQNAQKLMQQIQASGQTVNSAANQDFATKRRLEAELKTTLGQYKSAQAKALAPVEAKFKELDARASKDLQRTEAGDFYKPWAVKEYNALVPLYNAEVEKTSAAWFGAGGQFQAWLQSYRNYLVNESIPWLEKDENAGLAFAAFATDTKSGYKSTATLRGVADYLVQVDKVFNYRPSGPRGAMDRL